MIPPHQGGHRRNGSEFIGGDGKSGLTGLMSTSPTKGKGPVHLNLPRLPLLPKRLPTESRMIPPYQEVRDRVLNGIEKDTEATTTLTSKPAKRRSPKQKAAIETPTSSNANDNDFAAGYGSDGETRTENSTPSKAAAKKSRAPRKAKDNADGEPAVKK
ncbi:MAG: hypothetical protein Q9205_002976 [Flavoplaca limonia]